MKRRRIPGVTNLMWFRLTGEPKEPHIYGSICFVARNYWDSLRTGLLVRRNWWDEIE